MYFDLNYIAKVKQLKISALFTDFVKIFCLILFCICVGGVQLRKNPRFLYLKVIVWVSTEKNWA
jgi:hypothetical protein